MYQNVKQAISATESFIQIQLFYRQISENDYFTNPPIGKKTTWTNIKNKKSVLITIKAADCAGATTTQGNKIQK